MWLKVSTTNHDPAVILTYYLECVQKMNGNLPAFLIYCGTRVSILLFRVPYSSAIGLWN